MTLAIAGCLIGATGCEAGYVTARPAGVVYARLQGIPLAAGTLEVAASQGNSRKSL